MIKKKIALIHTGFALVEVLTKLFNKIIPEAELTHIVDDSLLREVLKEGKVTNPVRSRMLYYYRAAQDYNADVIFNVCSSVGEAADIAAQVIEAARIMGKERFTPKFVKQYINLSPMIKEALIQFKAEVEEGTFPGPEHSFTMSKEEAEKI